MKRREFIKSAGGLILLAGATPWNRLLAADVKSPVHPATSNRLNLLFITFDDMNGSMPGWMGNPLKLTPNMDAFAESCHRFTHNYGSAPICQPSREAIMTGLCPNRSGGYGFNPVNEGTPTLVTTLRAHGYFAGAVDKLSHMEPESSFPWDKSFDDQGKNPQLFDDEVTQLLAAAQAAGKPFFINVNIRDPHRPLYGSDNAKHMENTNAKEGSAGEPVNVLTKLITPQEATPPSFLEDLPVIRKDYAAYCNSVQRADMSFGKTIAALQAAGELDRTVIVFLADHGMPFPLAKATCYRNGSWCPVLLRWPGMNPAATYDFITSSLDVMPTLLEILNVPGPAMQDGLSWLPWLKSGGSPERDHAICNVNGNATGTFLPQRSVTTKTGAFMVNIWADGKNQFHSTDSHGISSRALKVAAKTNPRIAARVQQYFYGYPMAYYDFVKDPDQRVNVINDPAFAGEVKRLQQILLTYMETTNDPQLGNYKILLAGGTPQVDINMRKEKEGGDG